MRNESTSDAVAPRVLLLPLAHRGLLDRARRATRPAAAARQRGRRRPPARELAYVTNEGSGEVTVIDTATDSVVATIPVGTRPRGARVSADGKHRVRGPERLAPLSAHHARRGVREAQGGQDARTASA